MATNSRTSKAKIVPAIQTATRNRKLFHNLDVAAMRYWPVLRIARTARASREFGFKRRNISRCVNILSGRRSPLYAMPA